MNDEDCEHRKKLLRIGLIPVKYKLVIGLSGAQAIWWVPKATADEAVAAGKADYVNWDY